MFLLDASPRRSTSNCTKTGHKLLNRIRIVHTLHNVDSTFSVGVDFRVPLNHDLKPFSFIMWHIYGKGNDSLNNLIHSVNCELQHIHGEGQCEV